MENASKALLMAAGILVGILILALIVTLFVSFGGIPKEYAQTKQAEEIQQFNVNFYKYLGQDLNTHQVLTICNFARAKNVNVIGGIDNININNYSKDNIIKYELKINSYTNNGFVKEISIIQK